MSESQISYLAACLCKIIVWVAFILNLVIAINNVYLHSWWLASVHYALCCLMFSNLFEIYDNEIFEHEKSEIERELLQRSFDEDDPQEL